MASHDDAPTGSTDEPAARSSSSAEAPPAVDPVREYRGTGIMWTAVALIVAVALLVVVALQNTHEVDFNFLWLDANTPLILIIVITFGLAVVVTEAIGFVWRHRRRTRLRERAELERLRRDAGS